MPSKANKIPVSKEWKRLRSRMERRAERHGGNWRQVFIDCGGMCALCCSTKNLQFHEPFGEAKWDWGMFQSRLVLCAVCHTEEHGGIQIAGYLTMQYSKLAGDVDIEIIRYGGYQNWLKHFRLDDSTFGRFIIMKEGSL